MIVGDALGDALGAVLGTADGERVGDTLGDVLGEAVGERVGDTEGDRLGDALGSAVAPALVGSAVGDVLGRPAITPIVRIGSKEKPCSAYSVTPLPKKGMRRSTSVAPSESRVCTITAASTRPPTGQALKGDSVTLYNPPPVLTAVATMLPPTPGPSVPWVAMSVGMPCPLTATSSDTSVCSAAATLASLYSRTSIVSAADASASSELAEIDSTKRYFFASALSRYTASFCLNAPSCVGSSCDCCHAHSAPPW